MLYAQSVVLKVCRVVSPPHPLQKKKKKKAIMSTSLLAALSSCRSAGDESCIEKDVMVSPLLFMTGLVESVRRVAGMLGWAGGDQGGRTSSVRKAAG